MCCGVPDPFVVLSYRHHYFTGFGVRGLKKQRFKLSTIIFSFVCLVVLLSLTITDLLISENVTEDIRKSQGEKAQMVSRTVASSNVVVSGLDNGEGGSREIQTFTKEIQAATDVLFIVVMDMDGIRKSHPNPQEIGKPFVGGDEEEVLQGKEYISSSKGTLGKSLRAFTPVFNSQGEQVGAVAVGISLKEVDKALAASQRNFLTGTIIGLIVGGLGAVLLARYIKNTLLGLEPFAIARIYEERSIMLQSVHEGIVAVDPDSKITLVNKSAIQLFQKAGLSMSPIGKNIHEYMPSAGLGEVLKTGESRLDEEQRINGLSILVNHVPLVVKGQVVGAISTFRDKTEVNQLAEQLTGVKAYAEALRAHSHEFMNRLHVILGLVRMEMYDELTEFIHAIADHRKQEFGEITNKIKDPALAGFMMGKLSYAREENVEMSVVNETVIPEPEDPIITHELITIIGNLVDNAIESMYGAKEKFLELRLTCGPSSLTIQVSDSGPGIPDELQDKIFKKGFSTKGQNRGFGLYLVSKSIETLNGAFRVDSRAGGGTVFTVDIPYAPKGGVK